ncbi:Predicted flavoprotein CzcO associated with the cation diffusion facilitator CzcD [Variovorax sp. HW608]|uniref:flavin-containing monooxygenase n=1 Tax=Variovorax sp. HW608 TaxID=1034889 RepID=UPI0008201A37|nr:NAD(P)/FAD-dependent oxidoreductase [Variovorax sp. HW608]SCK29226.1 Predicted flavoprotein CzcO associated with the cation diffusion facilitator CzcD [Variovorax sp. HW608]
MKEGQAKPRRLDVVVVGGGFGGMYAIYKFREMGLTVQGIEAGGDLGGVWYWNRYPGARVDLPSIDYSYSFSPEIEQEWNWSEQFAGQPELLRYIDFVATRLDLRRHFQFNTRVTRAAWDEERQLWTVTTDRGEVYESPYCVMATGPLSIPKEPEIAGLARFKGRLLHAAKWPHEPVGLAGRRVGVIGTGSTGIQIVQEVGREAGELFVFQRTPSFTMPMRNVKLEPDYLAEVKRHYAGIREAARNSAVGGTRPQSTRAFFSVTPAQRRSLLEDAWKQGGLAMLGTFSDLLVNEEANETVAEFVRSKIGEVVKDPATAEALKPRGYPIFARRPCIDTEYYETYNLPNVHLVDCLSDPIVEVTEKGVRTEAGEVELDILILATGYDGLTGALTAFEVAGRDGRTVNDKWKEGARSYLGLMMEGFPNLFMTTGPNGPAALANIIRISENDVDWIAALIVHMHEQGLSAAEPTVQAENAWMDIVSALAGRSLITKAKTWWVGTNVKDKPSGLTMFTGGFQKYREHCAAAAADGFRSLAFERRQALADA